MRRYTIKYILSNDLIGDDVSLNCWVKNKRESTNIIFLVVNDGSTLFNLQVVVDKKNIDTKIFNSINVGASVNITGTVNSSSGEKQDVEILLKAIKILSPADDYPIQAKRHTLEFLREKAHLRFRTDTLNAVFRVRNAICFAIHEFFQERNFIYINTPILTSNDCEGAGDMFSVVTQSTTTGDYNTNFFDKTVNLTVSGQLEAEAAIYGLRNVYTFGPTFRAEDSNTTRHLAEFWMVEPEMAFCDIKEDIKLAEKFLKTVIKKTLSRCYDEITFLNDKSDKKDLLEKLELFISNDFEQIDYSSAIEILRDCEKNKNGQFKYKITEWGCDLQSEHERFLVEEYFKKPVVVKNYPEGIKSFYMRLNDDGRTVAAMDILVQGIGEIIGGSQREERLDFLISAMKKRNMNIEVLDWYIDTRRYGSVPHAGFGLGLERLVQLITGVDNIRDVIPFPRYPKHCDF